jgi:DNA polymerase-3 subunit gamma/tau
MHQDESCREAGGRMSLALYRKYRPGSFAEVVGQEHVTEPICAALDSGRIHHA